VNVLRMPPRLLGPMILGLTTIGVYAINNSMFDVWLMLGFGLLGYGMEKLDIPTAPAVLAVILGPLAESSLRRALLISGGDFGYLFSSAITWVLIVMTLGVLLYPLVQRRARPVDEILARQSESSDERL
ncbi:MAG: tripartite tricarboxylate transporter permease, partial [Paracoccus sp. (in: a-proteobacteria)]|nr:tripartite tricarboxylate transporter permease [Paracoccus sp. (in: a-proteobacteria)]